MFHLPDAAVQTLAIVPANYRLGHRVKNSEHRLHPGFGSINSLAVSPKSGKDPLQGLGTFYLLAVDNYKERSLQPFIAQFSWGLFWESSWIVEGS